MFSGGAKRGIRLCFRARPGSDAYHSSHASATLRFGKRRWSSQCRMIRLLEIRTNVPRHDDSNWSANPNAITSIKNFITNVYYADPANTKAVILIGHMPIPYSGMHNPDSHFSRCLPADGYYGDMDGVFTDSSVNGPAQESAVTEHVRHDNLRKVALLPRTTMRPGADAGYVNPVVVTVAGVPAGDRATLALLVFNGNSFETSSGFGTSAPITITLGNPDAPAQLIGLQAFTFNCIPEPSAFGLLLVGLGSALAYRFRRMVRDGKTANQRP